MKQEFENIENWDLLTKYFAGEAEENEVTEVLTWRNKEAGNERLFKQIKNTWETIEMVPDAEKIDVEKALSKLKYRFQNNNQNHVKLKVVKNSGSAFYRNFLKVAAVLVLALGLGIIVYKTAIKNDNLILLAATSENIEQILPDGTIVTLNANSTIKYPKQFDAKKRLVNIEGEAFFNVTPDKNKPFIIQAENAEIKVVGTSFNVLANKENKDVEVIVKSGIVQFYESSKKQQVKEKLTLQAGDKGIFKINTKILMKTINDDENYLAWKTKQMVFKDTEMLKVISTLQKVYHVEIQAQNQELNTRRLNANFNNQSIVSVMEVLKLTFGLEIKLEGKKYVLTGTGL